MTVEGSAGAVDQSRAGPPARWLDRLIPDLAVGLLRIGLPDGTEIVREGAVAGPEGAIRIRRWSAVARIAAFGEQGFTEAYLDGDWETPDLAALLEFCFHNERALARLGSEGWPTQFANRVRHWWRANTPRGSRRNIAAHYDLGNAFYSRWLDSTMNYSSAIYAGDETLEIAQVRKLARINTLLELSGRESVLEIGCGWGALAEATLRADAAHYVGITLSREQLAFARARLDRAGFAAKAEFRFEDYRHVEGQFDRIASIEMLEAVGERYWETYCGVLRQRLAPGGVAVLQAITIAPDRYDVYRRRPDFIQRYIFPGGMLPTAQILLHELERAGLMLEHIESFAQSYARTLHEWRRRFLDAWSDIAPLGFDARFRRMWEYYLAYCEIGFRFGAIDVSLIKLRG